jgi:hypothetical protein
MDAEARERIVESLRTAFGAAEDVTPRPQQALHVLLPEVQLPAPWTPSPTRALTVWGNWPAERPLFALDPSVRGEAGDPPRSYNDLYLLDTAWRGFSFSFPWNGTDDPVRVVQLWLTRFSLERT